MSGAGKNRRFATFVPSLRTETPQRGVSTAGKVFLRHNLEKLKTFCERAAFSFDAFEESSYTRCFHFLTGQFGPHRNSKIIAEFNQRRGIQNSLDRSVFFH
jgi:hypothetical protein